VNHLHIALGASLAAAALAAAAGIWWMSGPSEPWRLQAGDAGVVARGEAVYREHCASCHGAKLEGEPNWRTPDAEGYLPAPPHDETGHTWHHPDELLFRITRLGTAKAAKLDGYKSRMPGFDGVLDDADIAAALSYIKSTWPEEIRRRHDAMSRGQ
jgi:mono/diheme cytochrome c family protein